jgi:hypothetical protein
MAGSFRPFARVITALLVFLVGLPLWLLVGWQVVVVGLVGGPKDLVEVSVAGVAAAVVMLAVHEFGHYFAGRLAGLPPLSLTVGLLRIDWHGGRPKMLLNTQLFQPAAIARHASGSVSRGRQAAFVAGGPAASLLAGILCLEVAQTQNPGPPDMPAASRSRWRNTAVVWPGANVVALLNLSGLVSLYLGGATLVPGRYAGIRTDGSQLLDLAFGRGGEPADPVGHRTRANKRARLARRGPKRHRRWHGC